MENPDRIYEVVCGACAQSLGHVYPRHAEHLQDMHSCTATKEEWQQGLVDMKFAEQTGDATALTRRFNKR